jgi:hypothetical protein
VRKTIRARELLRNVLLAVALILFGGLSAIANDSPAPQDLVLKSTSVDVGGRPASHGQAPIEIPRHYANPALIGQIKARLAQEGGPSTSRGGPAQHTPKPSPSPSPSPIPTPSPTPAPVATPNGTPVSSSTPFASLGFFDGGGYVPPDTIVTAGSVNGTTELLEAVNLDGEVYTTSTNPPSGIAGIDITACTPSPGSDSISDPRVMYDSASGVWFIATLTFAPTADAGWGLLVSPANNPSSTTWNCIFIPTVGIKNPDASVGNFPDFPKLGMNGDKVVLSGDAFSTVQTRRSTSYKFQGTEFVVLNKSEVLGPAGTAVHETLFPPAQGDFAIEPAEHLGVGASTPGTLYMASVNSNVASTATLNVWSVTGLPSSNSSAQVSKTPLSIYTISTPPNAQQQGTNVLLDTNDDSLLDAAFRDGSLWVSGNDACIPPGDKTVRSCARLIQVAISVSNNITTMNVAQDFDFAQSGGYFYYPAVRTDGAGDLVTVFTGSSTGTFASVYAGVQKTSVANSANTLTASSMIYPGAAAYTVSPPRWGDYSGAATDPSDNSVWVAGEYANTPDIFFGSTWGTAIALVQP